MRKTYPTSSRSASAVEDEEYGEFPQDERAPRSRPRQPAGGVRGGPSRESLSRFDDFDERDLAFPDVEPAAPKTGRSNQAMRLPRDRTAKQVSRWQWLIRTTAGRWTLGCGVVLALLLMVAGSYLLREFLRTDPRFRVADSDQIQVDGNSQVTRDDVRAVFGEDLGRNLFFIPIRARQKQLESLPWVEHASVQRLLPNRIQVRLSERVPVAFAQSGDRVELIDQHGVLLETPSGPGAPQYSFPVLGGMGEDLAPSVRTARMGWYLAFVHQIDGHGEKVSARFSEVDLSDPEDMQVVMAEGSRALTVHFGDENYFDRYKLYQTHLGEWEQQYPRLAKVDLRNAPQVILGMGEAGTGAAKVAAAAPVSPVSSGSSVSGGGASLSAGGSGGTASAAADDTAPLSAAAVPVPAAAASAAQAGRAHAAPVHAASHAVLHPAKPKPVGKGKASAASARKSAALKKKKAAYPAGTSQGGRG